MLGPFPTGPLPASCFLVQGQWLVTWGLRKCQEGLTLWVPDISFLMLPLFIAPCLPLFFLPSWAQLCASTPPGSWHFHHKGVFFMRDEKCRQERASHSGSLGKGYRGQRPWGLKVSRKCAFPVHSPRRHFPFPKATDASDPDFPLAEGDSVPQIKEWMILPLRKKRVSLLPWPQHFQGVIWSSGTQFHSSKRKVEREGEKYR